MRQRAVEEHLREGLRYLKVDKLRGDQLEQTMFVLDNEGYILVVVCQIHEAIGASAQHVHGGAQVFLVYIAVVDDAAAAGRQMNERVAARLLLKVLNERDQKRGVPGY